MAEVGSEEGRESKRSKPIMIHALFRKTGCVLSLLVSSSVFATQMATIGTNESVENGPELHVISNSHVNRIVTPFTNPSLKMDSVGGIAYKQEGSVIYLSTTKDKNANIAAFVTEKNDESFAIPILLKPMSVGPQQIHLAKNTSNNGSQLARKFERSYPRNETIRRVLSALGKGDLPDGYTLGAINTKYLPECKQKGLSFDFYRGQLASGGDYVVTIGLVENVTKETIEFRENNCMAPNVVAVSSYPEVNLLPNEKTEVFVMYYRAKPVVTHKKSRTSLIEVTHD